MKGNDKLYTVKSVLISLGTFADIYEPAWNIALNEIGVKSTMFESHSYTLPSILGRIERRILWGPGIARMKREFVKLVKHVKPDVTLLYQGHYFDCNTLEEIRQHTFVSGYHNDDPFGTRKSMLRYRLMLKALPLYHGFHVFRPCNVEEALAHGIPRAKVLMPYYLPWMDYPRELNREDIKTLGCDVVFAGHMENDLRLDCIERAVSNGIRLRLYGDARFWKPVLSRDVYNKLRPLYKVHGDNYRKALCGSKIAACFLSKWNRDQYTTRSFEIPACGVFLLSERTPVMQEIYKEGKEAEYFSSPEEFLDKINFYLKYEEKRQRIADAGYQRVTTSGYDIYSRMNQWLHDVTDWMTEIKIG